MSTPRNTGSTPLRASRIARVVTALGRAVVVGGLATIVACSDTPTSPLGPQHAAPTRDLIGSTGSSTAVKVTGLLRDVPLTAPQTRTFTVKGNRGDVLQWLEMGLVVVVPPRAIPGKNRDMTITITALPGAVIAYDFGPDGSQFAEPLTVYQILRGTNYTKLAPGTRLRGAYFRSPTQIDATANSAVVDEFQPTELAFQGYVVAFKVTHFSGYMVSTD